MELAEALLDDHFCAVYQNRMNKLKNDKNGDLLEEFKISMKITINWHELKENMEKQCNEGQ